MKRFWKVDGVRVDEAKIVELSASDGFKGTCPVMAARFLGRKRKVLFDGYE